MRGTAPLARIAALPALIVAAGFIAVMLLSGSGGGYEVKARFQNASQLVKGNLVQVSGMPAGEVEDIRLTDDGQAELTLSIDDGYAPLRQGTHATVRQAARLETFSTDTRPLVQDLRPVAQDLQPTLADLRALAPDLERFFRDLDPLIDASEKGLPAARETLEGAEPLLARIHPFLGQLNPMLQYLEMSQLQVSDFISYGAAALADTTESPGGGVGHYLRQFGPTGAESAAIYPRRLKTNRGQTYVGPRHLFGPEAMTYLMSPSSDCSNAGGETRPSDGTPGCWTAHAQEFGGRIQGDFPHIEATDYSRKRD